MGDHWIFSASATAIVGRAATRAGVAEPSELVRSLSNELVELRQAAGLVDKVLAADDDAAEAFRGWLRRAADAAWADAGGSSPEPSDDGYEARGAPPHHWVGGAVWVDLFASAVAVARSDDDWVELLADLDFAFERAEWAESFHAAALDGEASSDWTAFARLAELYRIQAAASHALPASGSLTIRRSAGMVRRQKTPTKRAGKVTKRPGRKSPPRKPHGRKPPRRKPGHEPRPEGRPPRRRPHRPPSDWRAKERVMCFRRMRAAAQQSRDWSAAHEPAQPYVFADGITAIVPPRACAGQDIVIQGSGFGAARPPNISVMMASDEGCRIADVAVGQWQDDQITVTVPDWARAGCVGFFDQTAWEAYVAWREGLSERRERLANIAAGCGAKARPLTGEPVRRGCPPCNGSNYFQGTIPEILDFSADGDVDPVIGPDGEVTLSWRVLNADHITVRRLLVWGGIPLYDGPGGVDVTGSAPLTYALNADTDEFYAVEASNACSTVYAYARVHVRRPVNVTIVGIELNQSIQRFELGNSDAQNVVPLVKHKRTLVRVYLRSDHPPSYNGDGSVDQITGQLWADGHEVQPLVGATAQVDGGHDRTVLNHSLNFVLGHDDSAGSRTLELVVFSSDPFAAWGAQWDATVAEFNKIAPIKIVVLRVFDERRAHRVATSEEERDGLDKIMAAYPIAWIDGLDKWSTGDDELRVDLDFDEPQNWGAVDDFVSAMGEIPSAFVEVDLLDLIEEVAEEFEDNGEIWCAVVPKDAVSHPDTVETRGAGYGGNAWTYPKAAWLAEIGKNGLIAGHELGHAHGYGHEEGSIGDVGVDLRDPAHPRLLPPDTDRLMDKASNERWIDYDLYYAWPGMPVPRLRGGGGF